MIQDVLQFAADALASGRGAALITVTGTYGSSPAVVGQMMAVLSPKETCGTVGGGATEHRLIEQAAGALAGGQSSVPFAIDHGEEGMVCGGGMEGYITVLGAGPKLVLFGGGHVAQKIAPLAISVGFSVCVVEDRPELAAEFANVQYILATPAEYEKVVPLGEKTYVVICTRGHRSDDDALRFCLCKPLSYLGMIGSRNKVATLFTALQKEGVPPEELAKIYAPVGLAIASGSPAEIAVSVVAEMLLVKNKGSAAHLRDLPSEG